MNLAQKFEESRKHLLSVAYRLLGSSAEAEDAVQETWMRLSKSETAEIENLSGWLTTVVARVCLDMLRARKTRTEHALREEAEPTDIAGPERELQLAQSLGPALLVILDTLAPAERVAFVLHDLFDLNFDEIASILGRSPVATRQLASRARRRVQGPKTTPSETPQREIVTAFLKASREGNFTALLQLLDPNIVLRADDVAIKVSAANKEKGAPQFASEIHGADAIANLFKGKAAAAQLASVDGVAGATWIFGGEPKVAFTFTVADGKITDIGVIMSPYDLKEMNVQLLS